MRIEVKRRHEDMLKKTEENVRKLSGRLEDAKKKKLESLQQPERERTMSLQSETGTDHTTGMPHPNISLTTLTPLIPPSSSHMNLPPTQLTS